jgi:hypothetical protein
MDRGVIRRAGVDKPRHYIIAKSVNIQYSFN